ncbi:MAG: MMPL family transporter, partial [Gammaproteobacteria bacterium]|nr:MMPL family transporter [Gammaproteobacteria bacterium]
MNAKVHEVPRVVAFFEKIVFGNRPLLITVFVIVTLVMLWFARGLHVDAGFTKQLPTKHEYMQTYLDHQEEFGGANRVLVALVARDGNMFSEEFFRALKEATDEVFFIPGVERSRVSSLFTPNTRYIEVTEEGIEAGNVVPADFQATEAGLDRVRENLLKSNIVGRLVANDFSGAIISAQLLEVDPNSGEKLDVVRVSHDLEEKIRDRFGGEEFPNVDVHMIGFAKVIGDVTDGARVVVLFFLVAFIVTSLLVYFYTQSIRLSIFPLACSLIAVIWQLGLLTALGFGIDPMGILVPFLVFAIGVSHGVQMVSAARSEIFDGATSLEAAHTSFQRLLVPGAIALASDTIGFITIYFIEIRMLQEMAITASLGVAVIILTNLMLLPVLISYGNFDDTFRQRLAGRAEHLLPIWEKLTRVAQPKPAAVIIAISLGLLAFGLWKGSEIKVGDLHQGVPELRAESRYNQDTRVITERFSIGVDIITVIVETVPEGCINYDIMSSIDDFAWYMANVPGVQSVITLPVVSKVVNAGWNEGTLKWRVLSRITDNLVQASQSVDTSSGLLNSDCSVMPVMMFSEDHKAETIARIVDAVKDYRGAYGSDELKFRLATGNVGVMAATNEEVEAAQFPILLGVFSAVILLCIATFATQRAASFFLIPALIAAV